EPVRHRRFQFLPRNVRGKHRQGFTQINHLIQPAAEKIVDLGYGSFGVSPRKLPRCGGLLEDLAVFIDRIVSCYQWLMDTSGPTNSITSCLLLVINTVVCLPAILSG